MSKGERATKVRVTVTIDAVLAADGEAAVAAGRAPSMSAWVNEALRAASVREQKLAGMAKLIVEYEAEHGAFTDEELAEQQERDRVAAAEVRRAGEARRAAEEAGRKAG